MIPVATRLVVRLAHDEQAVVVEVVDDGVGFVPNDVTGSGLTGMRDRVEAVGGRLRILSSPGSGTHLTAELPARPRERADA